MQPAKMLAGRDDFCGRVGARLGRAAQEYEPQNTRIMVEPAKSSSLSLNKEHDKAKTIVMNNKFDELAKGLAQTEKGPGNAPTEPAQELEPDQERRWAQVVARAWDDQDFRQRLLAHPVDVLREAGFDLPDDAEVQVVDREPDENSEGVTCLRLPARPAADDLIEDDLSLPEDSARALDRDP